MVVDNRPKTADEYVALIDEALFEIAELRAAAEYDADSMGGALEFLGELEGGVRQLKQQMIDGVYHFEDRDLPFMKQVRRASDRLLPFKHLLQIINVTHREGLAVDEDD
ncbi:general secretion pathway protein GspF [Thiohalobacter sp. IOR34]|uniref:general secretion pathway protein GspF n=1 Tax=Thiohalobacter sp. IOR34 TaxID=3057176 RepID=UPI0025B21009|nr:general secretion pathway protein GspF [Thiohalobacter sp. IOR34]WJW74526.1 general secretion pathway protein GspF [Thiohalobacter sp. IOR34]